MLRRLRLLTTRILLGNIVVATLTSIAGSLILLLVLVLWIPTTTADNFSGLTMIDSLNWLYGAPDAQSHPEGFGYPPGFTLVVSPENRILHTVGDTPCRAEMLLEDCAPHLVGLEAGGHFFERDGARWAEVVLDTVTGPRAISQWGPPPPDLVLLLPGLPIKGTGQFIVVVGGAMAVLSIPIGAVLTWFLMRRPIHRLRTLARVSERFAGGDLKARIGDTRQDEVGALAQQFDDMANTLEQNFDVLRDLAQRNADLARKVEDTAIQAERVRISRDLHDSIAQGLFSLSVSAAGLPDLINRDPAASVQQARTMAELAEHTLLELRALLVDLRPTSVIQRGLADALEGLCEEWGTSHHILIDCNVLLAGKRIPATVEDVLYRVTQEALSNVVKHAGASAIDVAVVRGQRQVTLSVTDNGRGFDPTRAIHEGKFGLMSMRERARAVGGELFIESGLARDTAHGTTVRLVVPLEPEPVETGTNEAKIPT